MLKIFFSITIDSIGFHIKNLVGLTFGPEEGLRVIGHQVQ